MRIITCSDFLINEARVNKQEIIDALIDFFEKKPLIKTKKSDGPKSYSLPDEDGVYSITTLKRQFSDKYTSLQVSNALHDLMNDKSSGLKSVSVHIDEWNKKMPYFYMDLSDAKVKALKAKMEKQQKEHKEEVADKKPRKVAIKKPSGRIMTKRKTS